MTTIADALNLSEIPRRDKLRFTDRFNQAWLEEQRHVGDPLGDAVVLALKERFPIKSPDDMLVEVQRLAETEGGVYREFVDACYYLPPWVDFNAMKPGMRMFATMGPLIGLSILGGGVAGSAFHTNAEPVFTATGRFVVERGVHERLVETGGILFLIPLEGEVQPGGRHHRMVMKVRLLHGAIRHWIAERGGADGYDQVRHGTPINQEDMAYALLIFTYLNVRGLLRLGVRVTDEQIESLFLLWRYVGHVIGVQPDWLDLDIAEQKEFYEAFLLHQATPGEASLAALNLLDGAIAKVPGPVRPAVRRTIHQVTDRLGGHEYLSALHLDASGSRAGLLVILAYARIYGRVLRSRVGEALLYRWGLRSIRRRYAPAGNPVADHGYGVTTLDRAEIDEAMKRRKRRVAGRSA
jgi:hypothetical protein